MTPASREQHALIAIGGLTSRQREVLGQMADGLTNAQIAERLGVSLAGAKWHVSEVLSRLGVTSREEAAEVWKASRGPGARMRRWLGICMGGAGWKVAGGTAAAAVLAGAAVAATTLWNDRAAGATPSATTSAPLVVMSPLILAPTTTPSPGVPQFTEAEARSVADRLAREALAKHPEVTSADAGGHYLGLDDFVLVDHSFQHGSVVSMQLASRGWYWLDVDRRAWVFTYEARLPDIGVFPSRALIGVAFDDATGTPLMSDIVRPAYEASQHETALRNAIQGESSVAEVATSDGRWRLRVSVADAAACFAMVEDGGPLAAACFSPSELVAPDLVPIYPAESNAMAGVVRPDAVRVEVRDGGGRVVATAPVQIVTVFKSRRVGYFLAELPQPLSAAVVVAFDKPGREVGRGDIAN